MRQLVVVIGGDELSEAATAAVEPTAVVIAADSGLDHAVAAELSPSRLVGDLDSISASGMMWAYAHEIEIDRHPADKDATDTEMALDVALGEAAADDGSAHVLLIGGRGDRLDHTIAALLALGRPSMAAFASIEFVLGDARGHVLHPGATCLLTDPPGTTFSLLALHGACTGVDVVGGRWPLDDATLAPGQTLGVSNEVVSPTHVRTRTGVLTVIVP